MKSETRVLGIDDSPFKFNSRDVLVVGAFFRGGKSLEGVLSTHVRKDGNNATQKLVDMVNKSKFKAQIRAILLDGIALGGFNVIDIHKLNYNTSIPVIVVMRHYPDKEKMFTALRMIKQDKKIKLIEKAGEVYRINDIHIQVAGISVYNATRIVELTLGYAHIPEPLRIAHIIASGVVKGESYGRA
jgi:endonuclease V-like protein UPF0215 family